MNKKQKIEAIRRKTRLRMLFTLLTMGLYFCYVLNYTGSGASLGNTLGSSHISGSLVMYTGLIIIFIGLELVFLGINRNRGHK